MAATIKKKYGVEAQLIGGGGGIFDVKADGQIIYSKYQTGRFPEDVEVLEALSPRMA